MRDPYRDPLTLEITLQNDSWVEEVGMGNNPATRALAAGITASAANRNTGNCQKYDQYGTCIMGGWMDVVQPALLLKDGYKAITRVSETLVRVLFRSYPYYDVVAPDLIHVYVPKEAVLSNQLIVATIPDNPSAPIRIDASKGTGRFGGKTIFKEVDVREGSVFGAVPTLTLRLSRDQWLPTLGTPAGAFITRELLAGVTSLQSEDRGWNAIVQPALRAACTVDGCTSVERIDQETAEIRLPALRFYEITKPETLELRVPAVLSDQQIIAPNTVRIRAEPGWATVWGSSTRRAAGCRRRRRSARARSSRRRRCSSATCRCRGR